LTLKIMKGKWVIRGFLNLRIVTHFVIFILLIIPTVILYGYTGSSMPPMLKMDYGSQSMGMGGASVALNNNLFYMDSNPAGGMFFKVYRFSLLHQEWVYDTNYESLRATFGFGKFYIGAGLNYLYTPFKYYDYYGATSGDVYNISQYLGLINFGYKIDKWNVVLGANIKYFYYNVPQDLYENQSYSLITGDIGIVLPTDILKRFKGYLPSLVFGFTIKNIGYSSLLYYAPIEILAGMSYRYSDNLLFSIESSIPIYEPTSFSLGAEYSIQNRYFIDAGFKIKENPMFSIGFGYRKKDFRVRASYSPMLKFFNMLNITVSYSYGETKAERNKEKVEELLVKAIEYFSKGKYKESLETVAKVLDIDHNNYRAQKLFKIIEKQIEIEERIEEIQSKNNE